MKKWNWNAFFFILALTQLGAMSNKSIQSILDAFICGLVIGIPVGLLFAYMGKND